MAVWHRVRGATAHLASAQDRAAIASLRSNCGQRHKARLMRFLQVVIRKGPDAPIGEPGADFSIHLALTVSHVCTFTPDSGVEEGRPRRERQQRPEPAPALQHCTSNVNSESETPAALAVAVAVPAAGTSDQGPSSDPSQPGGSSSGVCDPRAQRTEGLSH